MVLERMYKRNDKSKNRDTKNFKNKLITSSINLISLLSFCFKVNLHNLLQVLSVYSHSFCFKIYISYIYLILLLLLSWCEKKNATNYKFVIILVDKGKVSFAHSICSFVGYLTWWQQYRAQLTEVFNASKHNEYNNISTRLNFFGYAIFFSWIFVQS